MVADNEGNMSYAGDCISVIYDQEGDVNNNIEPINDDVHFITATLENEAIGCTFCRKELTFNTGCYMFCQTREHYDRNVKVVACSDACQYAFACESVSVSKCKTCEREYIHDRYDDDICRLCKGE